MGKRLGSIFMNGFVAGGLNILLLSVIFYFFKIKDKYDIKIKKKRSDE